MRLVIPAALLFALTAPLAAQADEFPYEAFVATDEAEVVAGPGHRFYATDRLPRGTKVEIYREEPSGWLAIRPPDSSFSWMPGNFVELLDDDHLGRVTEAAGAWVGTSIEHVSQHHQQLALKQGELVQILGEKKVMAVSGQEQTWLKIAPPAGEYRWIHLRDVSRQKPPEQTPRIDAEVEEPEPVPAAISQKEKQPREEPRRFSPDAAAIALRDLDEAPARYLRTVEPAQFRTSPIADGRSASPDGFVARKRRDGDSAPQVAAAPIRTVTTPLSSPRFDSDTRLATAASNPASSFARSSTGRLGADEISRQFDQVELDLSLIIAQDRSQWNFADLKRRVESLVEKGADPASRGRARLMLDKIKQFEDTFRREGRFETARGSSATGDAAAAKTEPVSGSLADPRYDAQGWLKPVVSRKSDKPIAPFAVVDADGQPICFVSPSPGLNLHRYENKQVGLYGRRGYLESLKKPHLLAERVIELDSRWR